MVAEDREVRDALGHRAQQRRGDVGRCRRLEADREEHHLAVRVLAGDPQRVERRVDHAHVRALRLRLEQRPVPSGDAHHVAEAREDHLGVPRNRDPIVDAPHRDHADRTAGPVDELDVLGQQVVDAVLVDRVRVPAAHLHHLVVPARLDRREDLRGQRPPERAVAELVDELHGPSLTSATPASNSTWSPGSTGPMTVGEHLDSAVADDCVAPHHAHGHRNSLVGTRGTIDGVGHRKELAFRSSSSCS